MKIFIIITLLLGLIRATADSQYAKDRYETIGITFVMVMFITSIIFVVKV